MSQEGQVDTHWHEHPEGACTAEVVVNRPARLNALTLAMCEALAGSIEALHGTDARVIVLTGAGERAFIGGADLDTLASLDAGSAREFISAIHLVCDSIRRCPVPVIARINGYCLGAGLEIAASCDIRVAEPGAILGMPEVRVGLPSVIEAALLPQLIGWGHTRWMVFTGEPIDGNKAAQWGLIDVLAEHGGLDEAVGRNVASIVSAGPKAVRDQKRLISAWEKLSVEEGIAAGIEAFVRCYEQSTEPAEYIAAFVEARRRQKGKS